MILIFLPVIGLVIFVAAFAIASQFGNIDLDESRRARFMRIAILIIAPPSLAYLWVTVFVNIGLTMDSWIAGLGLPTAFVAFLLWAIIRLGFSRSSDV
jgi:hypothetical protein